MILRGFNSKYLITRGFGALVVVVEKVYKWCSSIVQQIEVPDTVKSIFRKNTIKQKPVDTSTIKAYFKRRG